MELLRLWMLTHCSFLKASFADILNSKSQYTIKGEQTENWCHLRKALELLASKDAVPSTEETCQELRNKQRATFPGSAELRWEAAKCLRSAVQFLSEAPPHWQLGLPKTQDSSPKFILSESKFLLFTYLLKNLLSSKGFRHSEIQIQVCSPFRPMRCNMLWRSTEDLPTQSIEDKV